MSGFIQRLFGARKSDSENEAKTRPIEQQEIVRVTEPQQEVVLNPPQLIVGCGQDVGLQRDHNEDALFTLTTTLSNDEANMPFGLYIVADGMGGHRHGEIASHVAVHVMGSHIIGKLYTPLFSLHAAPPSGSIQEIMRGGVQEAHNAILKEAEGGGTTLTALLVRGEQMTVAHVGDSRAYFLSADGELEALTRDHSLVERLVELGKISLEEAARHPQRNVLYRALGQGEPFEADVSTLPVRAGGQLLLCSDGLWGVVPQEKMVEIIRSAASPQAACHTLIAEANAAGGPDNITVILVRLPG
ncbi:MAG TPA: PP2C family serine/threonine-protein phosphatase [Anaerolineales bacterium]|nr:PP2C family serine/threonine-protein phosphatase [Anaerolineales bacterium]